MSTVLEKTSRRDLRKTVDGVILKRRRFSARENLLILTDEPKIFPNGGAKGSKEVEYVVERTKIGRRARRDLRFHFSFWFRVVGGGVRVFGDVGRASRGGGR